MIKMCDSNSKEGVKHLVELFESNLNFPPSLSEGETLPSNDRIDEESDTNAESLCMKRRSFARKERKPIVHSGGATSLELHDTFNVNSIKTFNRKAAVRRPSNTKRNPDFKTRFSMDNGPGIFSPRTSLKRQKSISADSLAEIRSNTSKRLANTGVTFVNCQEACKQCSQESASDDETIQMSGKPVMDPNTFGKDSSEILLHRLLRSSLSKDTEVTNEKTKITLDRTISDSTGMRRIQKARFVTFSTEVGGAQKASQSCIRRLKRTPTPYCETLQNITNAAAENEELDLSSSEFEVDVSE